MEKQSKSMGRREFGRAGLSAAALAALGGSAFAQPPAAKPSDAHHHAMMQMFAECAKACSDCQRACDSCSTHCATLLGQGQGKHMTTLRTCLDCASLCVAAAQVVARGGVFADLACQACADACKACGDECAKFPDDQHMKMCADQCRACEKACRDMVEHVGQMKKG